MFPSGRCRASTWLLAALTLVWVVLAASGRVDQDQAVVASDVLMPVLAALATASLLLAGLRRPPGRRRALVLLGLAAGCWTLGETVWGTYELVLGRDVPFPSAADVAYLAATPFAAAGLLSLPRGLRSRTRSARVLLDGWLLAGSLLLLSWSFVLAPLLRTSEDGGLAVVVSVAYPVSDVVLATLALLVARSVAGTQRIVTLVVVGAMLAMAVADSVYTAMQSSGSYVSGGLADAGYVLGYGLLGLAGRVDDPASAKEIDERPSGRTAALLPYFGLGLAGAALATQWLLGRQITVVQVLLLLSLIVALLIRQSLTVLDNVAMTEVLALRERHFRSLVHGARDVIVLCGKDLRATYVSPSSAEVLGREPESIVGRPLWELVHPEDLIAVRDALESVLSEAAPVGATRLQCRLASPRGWIDTESTVGDLRHDPGVAGIVITTRDVSDRSALERQLRRQARQDPLTGLANRTVLRERLEHALSMRAAGTTPIGLLLLDLDGFKAVNDSAGHQAGDTLLIEIAARLTAAVRQGDTVARLGGDEFAILLEDRGEGDLTEAGQLVAERILAAVRRPVFAGGRELAVGGSLGLVVARAESCVEDLMREADTALYASKSAGRARVTVYGPELQEQAVRDLELVAALPEAVGKGQMELGYQPVVDLADGRVVGVEALARWNHPTRGYISPGEFIPLAESYGLMDELGAWALTSAVRQGAAWRAAGAPLGVAVNVSARQLGAPLVALVTEVLAAAGLPPEDLTLELTESVLVDARATKTALTALRDLGVHLAVDDFGTGYSSLAYLRKLPVDVLKLDRSFVSELGTAQADALSRTVVQLAADLGLSVVAEGVETEEQRDALVEMGCGFAQGWLFGRPVPARLVRLEQARLQAAGSFWVPGPRQHNDVVPTCETIVPQI